MKKENLCNATCSTDSMFGSADDAGESQNSPVDRVEGARIFSTKNALGIPEVTLTQMNGRYRGSTEGVDDANRPD
jgi:hypothetical protein